MHQIVKSPTKNFLTLLVDPNQKVPQSITKQKKTPVCTCPEIQTKQ
jgi:hypothetical protein